MLIREGQNCENNFKAEAVATSTMEMLFDVDGIEKVGQVPNRSAFCHYGIEIR